MKGIAKKWWFWAIIIVVIAIIYFWRKGWFTLGYVPLAGMGKAEPSTSRLASKGGAGTGTGTGIGNQQACKKNCDDKYKPINDFWYGKYYQLPISNPPIPLTNPSITYQMYLQKMSEIGKSYDCCLIKCNNPKYGCEETLGNT